MSFLPSRASDPQCTLCDPVLLLLFQSAVRHVLRRASGTSTLPPGAQLPPLKVTPRVQHTSNSALQARALAQTAPVLKARSRVLHTMSFCAALLIFALSCSVLRSTQPQLEVCLHTCTLCSRVCALYLCTLCSIPTPMYQTHPHVVLSAWGRWGLANATHTMGACALIITHMGTTLCWVPLRPALQVNTATASVPVPTTLAGLTQSVLASRSPGCVCKHGGLAGRQRPMGPARLLHGTGS